MSERRTEIEAWYRAFQDRFAAALEGFDGTSTFRSDRWERPGGGGGDTRVLEGTRIEKAACSMSAVWGDSPPQLAARTSAPTFYATGVSIIVHPSNPYAPTFHANVRYFEAGDDAWFGGGADLTPWYVFDEDARHFHRTLAEVCDAHEVADYRAWKQQCDEYFSLSHRGEARGVGGVFFDHLDDRLDEVWSFQKALADSLETAYLPLVVNRSAMPFGPEQRRWHLQRRGRYVEFNLVWDRGTKFGLETGGRAESILASLPPEVRWDYAPEPEPGSPEWATRAILRGPPRDWLACD